MFDLQGERQSVLDLDSQNFSLAKLGNRLEKFDGLALQPEVTVVDLGPRPVLAADFQFPNDSRCGREYRLTGSHLELLNAAEVDRLHQFKKAALGLGKGRLG